MDLGFVLTQEVLGPVHEDARSSSLVAEGALGVEGVVEHVEGSRGEKGEGKDQLRLG